MDRLNYQHLYYFWTVAREGGVTRACKKLGLAQPTISAQLAVFESTIGAPLLRKEGRGLVLTEAGHTVFNFAEEIFTLGRELSNTLKNGVGARGQRLTIGVVNSLPKLVVYRLIEPILREAAASQIICYEDKRERLLTELTLHGVDLVITDAPELIVKGARVYNHPIGEAAVAAFATPELVERYKDDFPWSLRNAPLILQTTNTNLRRALDKWFDDHGITSRILAEIEDSALLKTFAAEGSGVIFTPIIVRNEIELRYGLKPLGVMPNVHESFYAISMQRKVENKLVTKILRHAREWLSLSS
jgi:LysR family transcriptional activator of nhaA